MLNSIKAVLTLVSLFLIAGCANGVGFHGSALWLDTAPENEVRKFMAKQSLYELSVLWDDGESYRPHVAKELEYRGLDPLKFRQATR